MVYKPKRLEILSSCKAQNWAWLARMLVSPTIVLYRSVHMLHVWGMREGQNFTSPNLVASCRFFLFTCMCACSVTSVMSDSATLWTVAHLAPPSMGFSRQEYWSGLPCPPPGDLPNPGIEPASLVSPALAGAFFSTSTTWEAPFLFTLVSKLLELINYVI